MQKLLNPPFGKRNVASASTMLYNNYDWDFYAEGGFVYGDN